MAECSAKTGTTIFAYFYLVVSVFSLSLVGFCLYVIAILVSYAGEVDPTVIFLSIGVIAPLVMIPFASVLVHGVRRKNPNCLIGFIVFGICKILFTVAICLFLLINHETCDKVFYKVCSQPFILLSPVAVCFVFSGILVMIGIAASKYRQERQLKPNSNYGPLPTHQYT